MVGFLLLYFGIYGGMNAYLFWKARKAFDLGWVGATALGLFLLLQVLAPILVRLLERGGHEGTAWGVAWVGYSWFALAFLFLCFGLSFDLYAWALKGAGLVLKRDLAGLAPGPLPSFLLPFGLCLLTMAYGFLEAASPRLVRVRIESPKVPAGEVLRVAQVSDLHLGLLIREKYLSKVLSLLEAERPDLVVATGDLVDGDMSGLDGLSSRLRELEPRLGKWAVTGNHEFYAGLPQALEFLRRSGFRVLRGEAVDVTPWLTVAGADDVQGRTFGGPVGKAPEDLATDTAEGRFLLLLDHRPRPGGVVARRVDLQLSGHTHRGQIFPFGLAVALAYPHPSGLVTLPGGGHLYTSRGTGTWGPPMRVFSPPEVTLFEIRGSERNPGAAQGT